MDDLVIPKMGKQRIYNGQGLPIAEELLCRETEMIAALDPFLLNMKLLNSKWDLNAVKHASLFTEGLPLHVNINPETFGLLNILEEDMHLELVKHILVFEILENGIDRHVEDIVRFAKKGYRLALDDFGRGESNYHLLDAFTPELVPVIKLDIIFQREYFHETGMRFVEKKIELLHSKGYKVYLEGIEHLVHMDRLRADGYQGFALHKPEVFLPKPRTEGRQKKRCLREGCECSVENLMYVCPALMLALRQESETGASMMNSKAGDGVS